MNNRFTNYMPKNYLSFYLYESFLSFGGLLFLVGSCRVDVKDRCVTRPSVYQKLYSIFIAILVGMMYATIRYVYMVQFKSNVVLHGVGDSFLTFHYIYYVVILFEIRFISNNKNVNFVINMQQIDRCMKIDRNKRLNTIMRKLNDVSVLLVLAAFFSLCVFSLYDGKVEGVFITITGAMGETVLFLDLILFSNLMAYFIIRIRFLNSIIANHLNRYAFMVHGRYLKANGYMRKLASKSHDFKTCETDIYLKNIMEGFYELQNIFRWQLFSFCCKFIVGLALYFTIILLALRVNKLAYVDELIIIYFFVTNTSLALLMCVRCEMFIREVKETKIMCIAIMSVYVDNGPLRDRARRMLEIIEARPARLTVYGLWNMEATFMLKLLNIITAIIVTLLQFTFL